MNLAFENLEKINNILEKLEQLENKILGEKRWLNTKEASYYLGYSKDHIHKLKDSHLIEGKHYFKKAGRILFDKLELDNWVTTSFSKNDIKSSIDSILKAII
ncbi:helix-turn-helix domain-containing protein [Arcobacter aquimarinus]|uniref:DNA-binding protein n=1 Tax=Arcobacter aquimarinus TaxID=1315211 RepID=A0AAE7DZF4_9BACT|nr:helix-turn-helix domain-containing protein [Arcobacter aquimarinus]QKE24863.1 putative DNA-binding protein [Arcobacter aquimarinus]RXI35407.1 DNA-binding protein [Arcobacter aquimarinus]